MNVNTNNTPNTISFFLRKYVTCTIVLDGNRWLAKQHSMNKRHRKMFTRVINFSTPVCTSVILPLQVAKTTHKEEK